MTYSFKNVACVDMVDIDVAKCNVLVENDGDLVRVPGELIAPDVLTAIIVPDPENGDRYGKLVNITYGQIMNAILNDGGVRFMYIGNKGVKTATRCILLYSELHLHFIEETDTTSVLVPFNQPRPAD